MTRVTTPWPRLDRGMDRYGAGVSRAARIEWVRLECRVEATLERAEGGSQFTRFVTFATLTIAEGTDPVKARALLERAEHSCLVSNSLRGARTLEAEIIT